MKHALLKDTLREVRKSLGRFLSIFAIVAIGVAFFAGVKASAPDMKATADHYYDDYRMMDLSLVSTVGFTDDDVDALRSVKGIEGISPTYTMDALAQVDTEQFVFKVKALPLGHLKQNDKEYINQAKLMKGRMPQKSGECVIEEGGVGSSLPLKIGDSVTLTSGKEDDISKSLQKDTYKIVGTVVTPYYLSYEKGSTTIGNGTINNFIMIPQEDFKMDYYTEINITVDGSRELDSYDNKYFDLLKPIEKEIKSLSKNRIDIRKQELIDLANDQIKVNQEELDRNKQIYEDGIREGEATLNLAKTQLDEGYAQITQYKEQLDIIDNVAFPALLDGEKKLKDAQAQFIKFQGQLAQLESATKIQTDALNVEINKTQKTYDDANTLYKQLEEDIKNPALSEDEKVEIQRRIEEAKKTMDVSSTSLTTLSKQVEDLNNEFIKQSAVVNEMKRQIDDNSKTLTSQRNELNENRNLLSAGIVEGEKMLSSSQKQYDQGISELKSSSESGGEELKIAQEKIDKASKEVEKKIDPKWHVLNRKQHYSYMEYGSVADRMDAIAKVFPVFFFLVAALVCLTTMTRMVDEQRGTIGALKALGYSKVAIAFKYVFYALVASLSGGIFGSIIGMIVFPLVIFSGWGIIYTLPPLEIVMHWDLAFIAIALVCAFTCIAAIGAVYADMFETPALLLRPKAPKNGKTILLERVKFIWKRFSFTQKVTARNIFRYKKRFLMTVIGISGCTALLLAGFGIRDSISQVADVQFKEIYQYDMVMNYEPSSSLKQRDDIYKEIQADKRFEEVLSVNQSSATVSSKDKDYAVNIIASDHPKKFADFIVLRDRSSHDKIDLPKEGVIVSEKLASDIGVGIGDTINVDPGDGVIGKVKVMGITENYIGHYLYMNTQGYKKSFDVTPKNNTVLADLRLNDKSGENQLGTELIARDGINSVSFYTGAYDTFSDTIASLGFVTLVLVVSAGLLAFVVLYNLSNVNISERLREIATIKVLGFYDKEVSSYVYRESIFLTLIGSFVGCGLGIVLHKIIMSLAELDNLMFGRNINLISFVYSILITMLFSIFVNIVMYYKLKKIPMVESLKSVE